jgi:hypothetical protein
MTDFEKDLPEGYHDDVLVFGYGIKGSENKIQPEMIPVGKNEWSVFINCGFAGF